MVSLKKKATMITTCEHCTRDNRISAEHLTKCDTSYIGGRSRYVKYTCPHCGGVNTLVSREVSVLILREMNDL